MNDHEAAPANYPHPPAPGAMPYTPAFGRPHDMLRALHDSVVRATREAIVTVDEQQCIVMLNPAAQRMFGFTAPEALGTSLSRFIPPEYHAAHAAHVREFARSGTVERPMAERRPVVGRRANGQTFPLEATISRVDFLDPSGPRHYFIAVLRDLSDVKSLQAEIMALNRRMRAVFDLAPVAVWITEADAIVFANHACAALFGADGPDDLIGRSIYTLVHPQSHSKVQQAMARALGTDAPVTQLCEKIARLDGEPRDVEIAVAALPDHGRTALQMVITDSTARLQEKQELERSRQELRQLSSNLVAAREEERRRIARELHDDLGQRLSALHMELSTLLPREAPDAQGRGITAMLGMIEETITSVRRIATELRPLMLDDLGLNAAIEWLAMDWGRRTGVAVELRLCQDDPPLSEVAATTLYRVVQEALTNVARHAHASTVKIRFRLGGEQLLFTVRDNGVGFPGAALGRVGSHGLLGIRERVHMLGGTVEIGNGANGGARIAIRLPLDAQPRNHEALQP